MKEFFRILNNAKLFWEYLVVGILFSVISIIGPRASGALVNAVIYEQETLQKNLLILVGIYGLQLLFSIWDQYYLKCFYRNQKRKMRDGVFETCLNQQGLNRERISLENISMVFEGNKKYLLTGESGSGKTTLLNLFIIREEL